MNVQQILVTALDIDGQTDEALHQTDIDDRGLETPGIGANGLRRLEVFQASRSASMERRMGYSL